MRNFCSGFAPRRSPVFGDRRFGGKGYFSGSFHLRKHRAVDKYRKQPLETIDSEVVRGAYLVGEVRVGDLFWLYG